MAKRETKDNSDEQLSKKSDAQLEENKLPTNLITKEKIAASPSSDDLDIEAPEAEDRVVSVGTLADRIRERLAGVGTAEKPKAKPRSKKHKVTRREQNELAEAARILLSPLLIIAITIPLGEACAPVEEEANGFVEPLARMIARHVPIPEHLSADLMDLLAMSAISVVWFTRIRGDLPSKGDDGKRPGPRVDGRPPLEREVDFDFQAVKPEPTELGVVVNDFLARGEE